MRRLDFGSWLSVVLAAVINSSALLMMNPFGIAYFAAAYMYPGGRWFMAAFALGGMFVVMPVKIVLKYACVMVSIMIIEKMWMLSRRHMPLWGMALVSGCLTCTAGFIYSIVINGLADIPLKETLLANILEGLAVFCLIFIFHKAIGVIRRKNAEENLNNQEQLAVGMLIAIAVYAVSGKTLERFSIMESLIFFSFLYMGYRYGSGASSIVSICVGSVLALLRNDIGMIGYCCIMGIVAGAFREYGRILQTLMLGIAVAVLGYLNVDVLIQLTTLRGLVAGGLVFMLIPEKYLQRVQKPVAVGPKNTMDMTDEHRAVQKQLRTFAHTFRHLSKTFCESVRPGTELTGEDVDHAFDEVTQNLCTKCSRCALCWEREYSETFQAANQILQYCSKYGLMESGHVPMPFKHRCINLGQFLDETNRAIEMAKVNLNWRNRLMESRLAIAGQFSEVADIIDDFSDTLEYEEQSNDSWEKAIKTKLSGRKMQVQSISVVTRKNLPIRVYIHGRMRGGRYVTAKEICMILKDVIHRDFTLGSGCRMVISKSYYTYEFVERPMYKMVDGIAACTKQGENISGDTYTLLELDDGQVIMSLSDGMGSGLQASHESAYIIQMLESLIESGFGKKQAVRLVNTLMFLKSDQASYSTVDVGMIDLYSGKCEFIKVGAAASYIRKGDGRVQVFASDSLPVGAFTELDYMSESVLLEEGDMVIMISDGISNSIDKIKDDQEEIRDEMKYFIEGQPDCSPQEMADGILDYAHSKCGENKDDMTVLVCGIYQNTH